MPARKKKVLEYERDGFTLLATAHSWIYEFLSQPELDLSPLLLEDGSIMHPGDSFTRIGGHRKSAFYSSIHLVSGYLTFAGLFDEPAEDSVHCLFSYSECDDPFVFYGGVIIERSPLKLMFSTAGVAGRAIETSKNDRLPLWQKALSDSAKDTILAP